MASDVKPASSNQSWTIRRILEWTIEHLKKNGSDTPRLDAEILLAHARGCPRIQLYVDYDTELDDEHRAIMRDLVKRRAAHEPVAYLVGFREFFSLEFEVQRGVLIPRPDTETLVLKALEQAKAFATPRVLDICTGSGCVAVAISKNCPSAQVVAVEIDPSVCEVANRNIAKHHLGERLQLRQGDLFQPVGGEQFEVITSNPPYVPDGEIQSLDPDVRLHEPELALRGGADGLDIVRRIIQQADPFLVSAGVLLIEISPEQADAVVNLYAVAGCFESAQIAKDSAGRSRVVWARKKS